MRSVLRPALLAALALTLGLGAVPAMAADPAAVLGRLKADLGLTGAEAEALGPPVRAHLSQGGREQGLRELVGAALAAGCRGACMAEAVGAANRAQAAGMPPMDALRLVTADLAGALAAGGPDGGPPSEAALGEAVRARMDARLGSWRPEATAPAPPPAEAPGAGWPPQRPRLP